MFCPHHLHMGLSTFGLGEASFFPLATFPGLRPSHFRSGPIFFLPFLECLLTLKDVPIHQLLIYSLFSLFFVCRGKSSENYLSGHLQISALLPGLQNTPADKASSNSVNSLCHARLIQFTIILSLPPFIPSTVTSFPKSKLSFLNFSSPDFCKALSTHDPNQCFKNV